MSKELTDQVGPNSYTLSAEQSERGGAMDAGHSMQKNRGAVVPLRLNFDRSFLR